MRGMNDILAAVILALGIWFLINPHGMGNFFETRVGQFSVGLEPALVVE